MNVENAKSQIEEKEGSTPPTQEYTLEEEESEEEIWEDPNPMQYRNPIKLSGRDLIRLNNAAADLYYSYVIGWETDDFQSGGFNFKKWMEIAGLESIYYISSKRNATVGCSGEPKRKVCRKARLGRGSTGTTSGSSKPLAHGDKAEGKSSLPITECPRPGFAGWSTWKLSKCKEHNRCPQVCDEAWKLRSAQHSGDGIPQGSSKQEVKQVFQNSNQATRRVNSGFNRPGVPWLHVDAQEKSTGLPVVDTNAKDEGGREAMDCVRYDDVALPTEGDS